MKLTSGTLPRLKLETALWLLLLFVTMAQKFTITVYAQENPVDQAFAELNRNFFPSEREMSTALGEYFAAANRPGLTQRDWDTVEAKLTQTDRFQNFPLDPTAKASVEKILVTPGFSERESLDRLLFLVEGERLSRWAKVFASRTWTADSGLESSLVRTYALRLLDYSEPFVNQIHHSIYETSIRDPKVSAVYDWARILCENCGLQAQFRAAEHIIQLAVSAPDSISLALDSVLVNDPKIAPLLDFRSRLFDTLQLETWLATACWGPQCLRVRKFLDIALHHKVTSVAERRDFLMALGRRQSALHLGPLSPTLAADAIWQWALVEKEIKLESKVEIRGFIQNYIDRLLTASTAEARIGPALYLEFLESTVRYFDPEGVGRNSRDTSRFMIDFMGSDRLIAVFVATLSMISEKADRASQISEREFEIFAELCGHSDFLSALKKNKIYLRSIVTSLTELERRLTAGDEFVRLRKVPFLRAALQKRLVNDGIRFLPDNEVLAALSMVSSLRSDGTQSLNGESTLPNFVEAISAGSDLSFFRRFAFRCRSLMSRLASGIGT